MRRSRVDMQGYLRRGRLECYLRFTRVHSRKWLHLTRRGFRRRRPGPLIFRSSITHSIHRKRSLVTRQADDGDTVRVFSATVPRTMPPSLRMTTSDAAAADALGGVVPSDVCAHTGAAKVKAPAATKRAENLIGKVPFNPSPGPPN